MMAACFDVVALPRGKREMARDLLNIWQCGLRLEAVNSLKGAHARWCQSIPSHLSFPLGNATHETPPPHLV